MQQSGGLLFADGWTAATPYFVAKALLRRSGKLEFGGLIKACHREPVTDVTGVAIPIDSADSHINGRNCHVA